MLAAARLEHGEIFFSEALLRFPVAGIERIHQAVSKSIGVDIEGRMNEMRDIAPERLISGPKPYRRAEAFALHFEPKLCQSFGREFARLPFGVHLSLEFVKGDLPDDGVQHVLDLLGKQRLALRSEERRVGKGRTGRRRAEHGNVSNN